MNTIDRETQILLRIIKDNLHNETQLKEYNNDNCINYNRLYDIANSNGIANLIADYICDWPSVPNDIKERFETQKLIVVKQQVLFKLVFKELTAILKENKIYSVVLKGYLLKDLYPKSNMRSMSDLDVFAKKEDIEKIFKLLEMKEYSFGKIDYGNHYEAYRYGTVKIEFHPELVALNSAYGDRVYSLCSDRDIPIADIMDVFANSSNIENNEFLRQLKPEYHYVYVIMHMMNHFLSGGTGIRSVVDVWIMNNHYSNTWNRKEIDELLNRFGLARFEEYTVRLADKWFSNSDFVFPDNQNSNSSQHFEMFEKYILHSGTYGCVNNSVISRLNSEQVKGSKMKYLLISVFPPYSKMCDLYPGLKKNPFLLPIMWIKKWITIIRVRKVTAVTKISAICKLDDQMKREQQELFDAII